MRKTLIALFLSILLISCQSKEYTALMRNLEKTADGVYLISFMISGSEDYYFTLTSPSGILSWSGMLENEGEDFFSAQIRITEGAVLLDGVYKWEIISSDGVESSGEYLFRSPDQTL